MGSSPFGAGFDQQMNAGMNPFAFTLPMESQQMLADSSSLDPSMSMMFSPQNYSYNPNGKPRNKPVHHQVSEGLNQTLAAPSLDTTFNTFDPSATFMPSPSSAFTDPAYTPQTPQFGFGGMGFDSGYGSDMFKSNNFDCSGTVTPLDDFSNMFTFPEPSSQEEQTLA